MKGNGGQRDVESKSIGRRIKTFLMPPYSNFSKLLMGGGGVIAAAIFTAFGEDLYQYTKTIINNEPDVPPWNYSMSLAVPHCHTGSLSVMFRDYEPVINWNGAADRLVICASALIKGPKEEFPLLLEERFPECLAVSSPSENRTISTKLDSSAVCRAPYRYDQGTLVETSLPNGLFICMPGHQREETQVSYRQDDVEVPVCKEEDLKEYNFL